MKCQKCDKPATFHITDMVDGAPSEVHLCEGCAQAFLAPPEQEAPHMMPEMAGLLAQAVGETAEELARLDERVCPMCGISFLEFRKQGRLGCPHDYVCFARELEPLLVSIHGETQHVGKAPRRCSENAEQRTQLIRLRREMKEAIAQEHYERASELRDKIRVVEKTRETPAKPSLSQE
ncbi:UvrB/uvrC motif protein [Pirellulimonas nuda]|uniref:UvrB/uvrC motif protein n=1 Tax=Pirellulimonas nuda TaxID=2528009 RepID=A0A518D814_9BACT|nr:UvrB/UvrC motif-containing protein [Pirellulimonas nuda]QDU87595.1 UvrB/uvrC motif protein [Pirellulimonas nuda]